MPLLLPNLNATLAKAKASYESSPFHGNMFIATPSFGIPFTAKEKSTKDGSYVKDMVTHIVMDDLVVLPMSTISSITLLNWFNVKDLGSLEDKVIDLGLKEVREWLSLSIFELVISCDVFDIILCSHVINFLSYCAYIYIFIWLHLGFGTAESFLAIEYCSHGCLSF